MPIDGCEYTFVELASQVSPRYMATLWKSIESPLEMGQFAVPGNGVKTLARMLGRTEDFPACYVLSDHEAPVYVGISRTVIQRLRQHVRGKSHFDASLSHRMATAARPTGHTRIGAMNDAAFRQEFLKARERIASFAVALVEIRNPLELYLFEAYCAMILDTSEWNTFATH